MSVIDTLTDADIEQAAKDYIDFAATVECLVRRYKADPAGRELSAAKDKAEYFRRRARMLRAALNKQGS